MEIISISLSNDMKRFVEEETARRGFGTVSEFVQAIIREEQEARADRDRLDAQLLAGLDSGSATPLSENDWERIRRQGKALVARRRER